jgi:hypothetical protein
MRCQLLRLARYRVCATSFNVIPGITMKPVFGLDNFKMRKKLLLFDMSKNRNVTRA